MDKLKWKLISRVANCIALLIRKERVNIIGRGVNYSLSKHKINETIVLVLLEPVSILILQKFGYCGR